MSSRNLMEEVYQVCSCRASASLLRAEASSDSGAPGWLQTRFWHRGSIPPLPTSEGIRLDEERRCQRRG